MRSLCETYLKIHLLALSYSPIFKKSWGHHTKVRSKTTCTKLKTNAVIVVLLYFKPQGTVIYELFSQGTYNFQNLRSKTLAIPDHECVNIFKFADLDMD